MKEIFSLSFFLIFNMYYQYYQFLIEHIGNFIEQFLIIFIINIFDSK